MIKTTLNLARKIRAWMTKKLRPKSKYFLFPPKHSLDSISCCYGFDRGTPVDRYYIEKFLEENKDEIRGRCLEITDNVYTRRFGKNRVKKSDVLDIDKKNNKANIHGDLRDLKEIKNDVYDCVIATHTFGVIDEYQKAVKECYRILKPGGTLVATVSALGVAVELEKSFWRFTETSVRYVFGKFFGQENIKVCSLGNVLSGQAFWVGLAAEELSEEELNYNDPRYSIIVGVIANK